MGTWTSRLVPFLRSRKSPIGTKLPIKNVRCDVRLQGRSGQRLSAQLRPELTQLRHRVCLKAMPRCPSEAPVHRIGYPPPDFWSLDAKTRFYRRFEWGRCVALDCWCARARQILPDRLPRSSPRRGHDVGEAIFRTVAGSWATTMARTLR
jgi:hypothetical protein